jgi:gamma-glutamyltranspeptidase
MPDQIVVERFSLPDDVQKNLKHKGHSIRIVSSLARTHIIVIDDDRNRTAAADPRGHGSVSGY